MDNFGIQVDTYDTDDDLDGHIFELFEKTPNREFKRHVQFIKADSLCKAEDLASVAEPDYWKNKSVRPVNMSYVWDTFSQLYYSYSLAKSILGLDNFHGE